MLNNLKIEAYPPTGLLRPFIKKYLIIESQEELINRILPDTSLVIAFRYKGQVDYVTGSASHNLPASVISGLRKSARFIHYAKNTGNILVLFKVTGVRAFFEAPLHELYEESVSLTNFISPQQLSILEEQLAGSPDNLQRITLVEQFFLSRLQYTKSDKLVVTAIQKIYSANGFLPIKELANSLCISQDALEKRFRKIVGTTPKQFSSLVRMRAVINQTPPTLNLIHLALEAGFFDQSHFIKTFKLFTGQTPNEFSKSPLFW